METKLVIRKAVKEDKEAVLKIHDHVYDGHDYLPAYYDHFLSKSDFNPFVLLLNENIIGFEVIQKVDDGQTMIGRAKRIDPKYERQGYIKQFSMSLEEFKKQNNIKRVAFTITDANPAIKRPSFQSLYRHVLTRQMPLYCMDVLSTELSKHDVQEAMKLSAASETKVAEHFSSSQIRDYISREGYMIVDMVPLEMIPSNIPHMWGPDGFTSVYSDIRVENGKCRGLLSFGTTFAVQRPPFHCNLDIFGNDTSTLRSHIVRHLISMQTNIPVTGVVGIMPIVQEDFDTLYLDTVFEQFGVERKVWYDSTYPDLKYSQLYLYDKNEH